MSQLSMDAMLRAIDRVAVEEFSRQGSIRSRAVLITLTDLLDHPMDWSDDTGKAKALDGLRRRLKEVRPERLAILGEAWIAPDGPLPASKSDQRVEAIYIYLLEPSGRSLLATRPIETPHWRADVKPVLGKVTITEDVDGLFAELARW